MSAFVLDQQPVSPYKNGFSPVMKNSLCAIAGLALLVASLTATAETWTFQPVPDLRVEQGPIPAGNGMVFVYDAAGRLLQLDSRLSPIVRAASLPNPKSLFFHAKHSGDGYPQAVLYGLVRADTIQRMDRDGGGPEEGSGLSEVTASGGPYRFPDLSFFGAIPVLMVGDPGGRVVGLMPGMTGTAVSATLNVPLVDIATSQLDRDVFYVTVRRSRELLYSRIGQSRGEPLVADLPFDGGALTHLGPHELLVLPAASSEGKEGIGTLAVVDTIQRSVRQISVTVPNGVSFRRCARLAATVLCSDQQGNLFQSQPVAGGILGANVWLDDPTLDPINGSMNVQVAPGPRDKALEISLRYAHGVQSRKFSVKLPADMSFSIPQIQVPREATEGPYVVSSIEAALIDRDGTARQSLVFPVDTYWPAYKPGVLGIRARHLASDVATVTVSALIPEPGKHHVHVEIPGPDGRVYGADGVIDGGALARVELKVNRDLRANQAHETKTVSARIKVSDGKVYEKSVGSTIRWQPIVVADATLGNDLASLERLVVEGCEKCAHYSRNVARKIEDLIAKLGPSEAGNPRFHQLVIDYYLRRYGVSGITADRIAPHVTALRLVEPGNKDVSVYAAVGLIASGQLLAASDALAAADKGGATTPWLGSLRAVVLASESQYVAAEAAAATVTKLPVQGVPRDAAVRLAYEIVGGIAVEQKKYRDAVAIYERALATHFPDDVCMLSRLATTQIAYAGSFADGIDTAARMQGQTCDEEVASLVAAAHVVMAAGLAGEARQKRLLTGVSSGIPSELIATRLLRHEVMAVGLPLLLEVTPDALTRTNRDGYDAAVQLVFVGSVEGLRRLVARNGSLEGRYGPDGWTLLMLAIWSGQEDVVRYLAKSTGQLALKSVSGLSAIDVAKQAQSSPEIMRLLAPAGV